ncbi:MAG: uroporphyrinogen-III synthase [Marinicaulis sp.]|nr:uroporphyrinogen-III synthase [Marinicaulis sp.]
MKILNTRPAQDSEAFAEACRSAGLTPVACPVMTIEHLRIDVDSSSIGALAFTSANGVRAYSANSTRRDMRVFAVGDATADAARDAGFADVTAAGGDVDALAELIASEHFPDAGEVYHAAGDRLAGDLVGLLSEKGIAARKQAHYRARNVQQLPSDVCAAMANGEIDGVAFFSPRTAALFITLAEKAAIAKYCESVAAACFSENVADAARAIKWRSIEVPHKRNLTAMAALLK